MPRPLLVLRGRRPARRSILVWAIHIHSRGLFRYVRHRQRGRTALLNLPSRHKSHRHTPSRYDLRRVRRPKQG